MKYLSVLLSLPLFYLFGGNTEPTDFKITDHLVAYYSFNQCDARDDSGNGSSGIMMGDVNCWCGIEDKGLLFDGVNDYLEFEGMVNQYFTTSDFTISFYVKPEKYSIFQQSMLSKRNNCEENKMLDILLDQQNTVIHTDIHESPYKDYSNISPQYEGSGWVHYALVREGTIARTYINGQLVRKGFRCSGVDITNETNLSFSNSPCISRSGARRFKGILDELRIYERALDDKEVKVIYDHFPIENIDSDCAS